MQGQRSNQKRAIKKNVLLNCKMLLFSFFFILTPPTSSMHNFLIFFVQIEQFKLLCNCHLKLYKLSSNSKGNIVIFRDFLRGSKIGYELFDQKNSVKTTPLTSRGHNFLTSNPFLPIVIAMDAQGGGLHPLIGHHKPWGLAAKLTKNPTLNVL
jgi:hypothetical protein